jgi:hypothetical protein
MFHDHGFHFHRHNHCPTGGDHCKHYCHDCGVEYCCKCGKEFGGTRITWGNNFTYRGSSTLPFMECGDKVKVSCQSHYHL